VDLTYLLNLSPTNLPELTSLLNHPSGFAFGEMDEEDRNIQGSQTWVTEYPVSAQLLDAYHYGLSWKIYDYYSKLDEESWQSWNWDDRRINTALNRLIEKDALDSIQLNGRRINTLAPLRRLQKLQYLNLGHTHFKELSELSMFPRLSGLDIQYNGIDTLQELPVLPSLSRLDLTGNTIQSFTFLSRLPALEYLNMSSQNISSLADLPPHARLQTLDLSENPLTDYKPLHRLKNLKTLRLSLSDQATLDSLKTEFPDIHIEANLGTIPQTINTYSSDN
jgi:hypothetical protein